MAAYDFSIRTKLALWAGIGVLLVAGMLAEQQYGERLAGRQRLAADNKQLAAVAALRAAHDVRSMQIESREIRLAIAPSEVDRALSRFDAHEASAAGQGSDVVGYLGGCESGAVAGCRMHVDIVDQDRVNL